MDIPEFRDTDTRSIAYIKSPCYNEALRGKIDKDFTQLMVSPFHPKVRIDRGRYRGGEQNIRDKLFNVYHQGDKIKEDRWVGHETCVRE
jgi:hypothetical protein